MLAAMVSLSGAFAALAQVPQLINYQGRIAVNGTNFTGTGQFKFALITASTNASVPATATGNVSFGFLVNIALTGGGSGYTTPPTVTITDSTGNGANAYAQISSGLVTNIVVTSAGSGYSASPSITIAPAPLLNSLWSNDGTSSGGSQPTVSVPLSVIKGLYSVLLGDTTLSNMAALPTFGFTNSDVRLRAWFNDGMTGFQQLTPDQRLAAVGYAIMAGTAQTVPDGSITTSKIALGAVGAAQIAPGSIGVSQLTPAAANGLMTLQVPNSTNLQAGVNSSYFFTNTAANQLTLPANPTVGDRVRVSGGAGGITVVANTGQSVYSLQSFSWTPRGVLDRYSVASSSDGSKLVVAQFYGGISTSTNYGMAWVQQTNGIPPMPLGGYNWQCIASSGDGSKIVAGGSAGAGSLYSSTNYGVNWMLLLNLGSGYGWSAIANSSDGSKLLAGGNHEYFSQDYGMTWSYNTVNLGNTSGGPYAAMSSDGSVLFDGTLKSINYGGTWSGYPTGTYGSPANGPPQGASVACSSDGSKVLAGETTVEAFGAYPYISTDYGVTWSITGASLGTSLPDTGGWKCVAMNGDGSKLAVAKSNGYIYLSTDSGNTWTQQTAAGVGDWCSIAFSGDGNRLIAGQNNGHYFVRPNYITQSSTVYVFGSAYANIELVYAGGGLWVPAACTGSFTIQ